MRWQRMRSRSATLRDDRLTFSHPRRNLFHALPVNKQEAGCAGNRSFANHPSKLMSGESKNQRVAILLTDGFEESELTEPLEMLRRNGAEVDIISLRSGEIQGMQRKEKRNKVKLDIALDQGKADNYIALGLSEGLANTDALHTHCPWFVAGPRQPGRCAQPSAFHSCRAPIRRCQRANRGNLPWAVDVNSSRCSARPANDLVAVAEDGPEECGRRMGQRGSRG